MKQLIIALLLILTTSQAQALEQPEMAFLTGDTRLACEAILCLSSGDKPSECAPSLNRYFRIDKKKWKDTFKARVNFLKLCPDDKNELSSAGLLDAIVQGAGRCTADALNKKLARQVTFIREAICTTKVWDEDKHVTRSYPCQPSITAQVISTDLPSYCKTYTDHKWTWNVGVRYQGTLELDKFQNSINFGEITHEELQQKVHEMTSGKWVDTN